jgi:signal transduction histidine kinase
MRITQEALANVHRHAFAQHVEVCVKIHTATVSLRIKDDGRGMAPEYVSTGMGLPGIRTRIEGLGGSLQLSSDRNGTTVEVTAPLAIASPCSESA